MAWYNESVFYHIYPLGLLGAPQENTYGEVTHRLRALDAWIEYLLEYNFNAVYIGPLFESVGHGYETTDYYKLDSRLGDNEDLKHFVAKCHENGIRVIFDGVFNHTGRDFFAFRDLKEHREASRYRDWYCNVNFWGNNAYNDGFSYENWGGYDLLVKLNQRNPEVVEYLCNVVRFWVSEFDVDGIRLDAADVLDFDFMRALRKTANEVKQDFWLMGEVIHGDYGRWVNDSTLHSVTNYALHKALFSGHNEHNYFEIAHTVKRTMDLVGQNSRQLYNFVDNHDVERIATKVHNKANLIPIYTLDYTLPGIPSVYYGSELAVEGRKESYSDVSLRPALDISWVHTQCDSTLLQVISRLGRLRIENPALVYGDYRELLLMNKQFAYARTLQEECVVSAVNNDEAPASISLHQVMDGTYQGLLSGETHIVCGGELAFNLNANSAEVWVRKIDHLKNDGFAPIIFTPAPKPVPEPEKDLADKPEVPCEKKQEKKVDISAEVTEASKMPHEESEHVVGGAAEKYGLSAAYAAIDPERIAQRTDYEKMSMQELQVAILEKMAQNGPVNDQMIRTVMENVYMDSLNNWVRSFR